MLPSTKDLVQILFYLHCPLISLMLLTYLIKFVLVDNSLKPLHGVPSQRRSRTDSDISTSMDDDRPPSRDYRGSLLRDDRFRHSSHRSYDSRKSSGYYDEYNRNYRDHDYDDGHSRDSWERERYFDDKDRDSKDNLESREVRENRDVRDSRVSRDNRDVRENRERDNKVKKDYDNYLKVFSIFYRQSIN